MATGRSEFIIVSGPEFTMVANALRDVDSRLPSQLRKEMKDRVKPAVADAKSHARSMPIAGTSGKHTGLRRRVAAGVSTRAGVGRNAYMRITTSMSNPNEAIIPRGLDRPEGWKHPVFGHRDRWVQQRPVGDGWFRNVIAGHHDDIEEGLTNALEWARNTVASAGGTPHPGA